MKTNIILTAAAVAAGLAAAGVIGLAWHCVLRDKGGKCRCGLSASDIGKMPDNVCDMFAEVVSRECGFAD